MSQRPQIARSLCTLAFLLLGGSAALAQAGAPGSGFHPTYGPPVAGICVFSQAQALGQSAAGRAAAQQLQGYAKTIQAELESERTGIVNDDRTLQARKASLSAAQYQQSASQLQQRATAFDRKTRTRSDQLQRTRADASQQVVAVLTPILAGAISAHRCGLVVERSGIYGANAAMDLTPEVTRTLNAKLPAVRVTLAPPTQPPGGG